MVKNKDYSVRYIIRIYDDNDRRMWQFYKRFEDGKPIYSKMASDAYTYVVRHWAEKRLNKINDDYNSMLFFNGIRAEIVEVYK